MLGNHITIYDIKLASMSRSNYTNTAQFFLKSLCHKTTHFVRALLHAKFNPAFKLLHSMTYSVPLISYLYHIKTEWHNSDWKSSMLKRHIISLSDTHSPSLSHNLLQHTWFQLWHILCSCEIHSAHITPSKTWSLTDTGLSTGHWHTYKRHLWNLIPLTQVPSSAVFHCHSIPHAKSRPQLSKTSHRLKILQEFTFK